MTIGVGVLGTGFMGHTWSEVARRHASGTHLAAVAGGRRAAQLASDYDVPLSPSFEALLARGDVDLVVLATPPDGHRDQAIAAARAGKHVLVEKPMTATVAEAAEMVDAADAAAIRLGVVSQHRFRGAPVAAKRAIQAGRLGRLRMARITGGEVGWWDMDSRGDMWKKDPKIQTAYASWAAHACDLLRWMLGRQAVRAFGQAVSYSGFVPNESAMVTYTFEDGTMADVWMTYELPAPGLGSGLQYLLVGSEAMLTLDVYGQVQLSSAAGWEVIFEQEPFDPLDAVDPKRLQAYARQLEDVVAAIQARRDPLVSGREGLLTTEMLEAAERSFASGEAVDLPLGASTAPR